MEEKLASILLSVYNKAEFLDKCIASLREQTYKNIEIVLVDDGSTDNSLAVCKRYAKLDKRIKVVHQENQGLCGARNTDLQNCCGEYIFWVDPDDYVDSSLVKDSVEAMEKFQADIVLLGVNIMNGDKCTGGRDWDTRFSSDQLKLISGCINGWELWGRAYRRHLWDGVRFDAKLRTTENVYVTGILMERAKKVIALPKRYYYWQRAPHGSIVQTRKAKSYRDEFIGWVHSRDMNSSPVFKEICEQRILIAAGKALFKNRKDHTLSEEQKVEIQQYYQSHTAIPLSNAALIYFKYRKEVLSERVTGQISQSTMKSALKMYAINSVQHILPVGDEKNLENFIALHSANNLRLEYRLLYRAIIHKQKVLYRLVGRVLKAK